MSRWIQSIPGSFSTSSHRDPSFRRVHEVRREVVPSFLVPFLPRVREEVLQVQDPTFLVGLEEEDPTSLVGLEDHLVHEAGEEDRRGLEAVEEDHQVHVDRGEVRDGGHGDGHEVRGHVHGGDRVDASLLSCYPRKGLQNNSRQQHRGHFLVRKQQLVENERISKHDGSRDEAVHRQP